MNKKLHSIFIGLSFLAIGLAVGLYINGEAKGLKTNVLESSGTTPEPQKESFEFVSVSADDDAFIGNENAPVTIVEFSDYECYYCHIFQNQTFPMIYNDYISKGLVKFVYRDFPFTQHQYANLAAEAAECVGESGDEKYFQMHGMIFARPDEWVGSEDGKSVFVGFAKEIGIDIQSCIDNGDMKDEIADDLAAARSYGVEGTPTFFINGYKVVGAREYALFKEIIDKELSK